MAWLVLVVAGVLETAWAALGTGYAVWVGIGAVETAVYGIFALHDPATIGRIACLILIVAGVVGLKVLH
ncbi:SMR family transporter [Amycolatopsis sp. NPDC049253]|uniref:DMT family transporter n=1 Tax=Amycolatopsis sp. NPDC049253 TaxID=3155274 RepID=UPI003416311C